MAAREIAELLGLAPLQPQQIGRARHVDVEESATHQEVAGLGGDVLGELGEALGGNDAGETALAAPAHQVGHRAERQAAHLVRHLACHGGREKLRFVHHDQRRIPMLARGIEQRREEGGGGAHLAFDLQPLQRQHDRHALLADTQRQAAQFRFAVRAAIHHDVTEAIRKGDEIALRIDDDLLHPFGRAFEQAAQQVRLAGARIALDEQSGGEQFFEVHGGDSTVRRGAHVDGNGHEAGLGGGGALAKRVGPKHPQK